MDGPEGEEKDTDEDEDDAPLAIVATVRDLAKWMPEGVAAVYGSRPVWFLLEMDADLLTIFEQLPEDPMPKGKVEAILSGLRTFAKEKNAELQQVLGPTDGISFGFHVDAPLARAIEAIEEDGFDVLEILRDGEIDLREDVDASPGDPAG